MIPNKRIANSDELFQKSFHENVNKKKKFCSIDVEKSLNDGVVVNWKKFFFDLKLGSDGILPIIVTHCGSPATNSQTRYNRELEKRLQEQTITKNVTESRPHQELNEKLTLKENNLETKHSR